MTLSQKKFCADGEIAGREVAVGYTCTNKLCPIITGYNKGFENYLWQIPVTIATAKNKEAYKFVLDKPSMTVTLDNIDPQDWIKV